MTEHLPSIRSALLTAQDLLDEILAAEHDRRPHKQPTVTYGLNESYKAVRRALFCLDGMETEFRLLFKASSPAKGGGA